LRRIVECLRPNRKPDLCSGGAAALFHISVAHFYSANKTRPTLRLAGRVRTEIADCVAKSPVSGLSTGNLSDLA